MKTAKMNRRALLMSVISLILCCAMLIGTTLAWFTDSVSSANNVINAGNLDVELYYKNDVQTDYTPVKVDTNIFKTETLWEPGHTEVVKLKVANLGSLALKYQLGINIASETGSVNMEGKEFLVSDYIKFAVIEGDQNYTREEAVAAAEAASAQPIKSGYSSKTTNLLATEAKEVTLVVYMPETVGNEANHGYGKDQPVINLGLNLSATQVEYEHDSFGPDYDGGSIYADKTYTVEDQATLAEILAEVETGTEATVLVNLSKDEEWVTGAGIGSTPWIGEDAAVQNLVVDANSKTITAKGAGVGAIRMANGGTLTIRNAKIADESVSYAENSWEYGYLEMAGNLVFENCEFVGAVMMDGDSAIFRNCSFISTKESEYDVWVSNGTVSFTDCEFNGYRGLKIHEAYGSEVVSVSAEKCVFGPLSKKPGVAIGDVNADTTVSLKNNAFTDVQAGDQGLYIYETDTDVTTFNFIEENNNVATTKNVTSSTELADVLSNAGQSGAGNTVIRIDSDLDLSGSTWTPINVDGYNGADIVTIDGNGKTITGLTAPLFQGGFAGGSGIVIKNLTIADSNIVSTNTQGSGAFIETVDSMDVITLTNCHLKNSTLSGSRTGGLIGWTAGYNNTNDGPVKLNVSVENCSVIGCEINASGSLGGIIGHSGGNAWTYTVVKNCIVQNNTFTSTDEGSWRVGAVIGTVNVGEQNDIINITSSGNTLTQTGKTAPEGQSNLYGRFVPNSTGKLTIDGVSVTG